MSTIQVKPHPDLDPAAWPLLKHPASGGLLDAAKAVPDDGRPWLYDGFTCRMLTDGAIARADDPMFAKPEPVEEQKALPATDPEPSEEAKAPPPDASEPDPAH